MQQMLAIEQSSVDREATRLDKEASVHKKEKAQAAELRELDRQNGRPVGLFHETVGRSTRSPSKNSTTSTSTTSAPSEIY